jgi:hypothetical protein
MAFRKKHKRKDGDGSAKKWNPAEAQPSFLSTYPYYVQLEMLSQEELTKALQQVGARVGARAKRSSAASTRPKRGSRARTPRPA